MPVIIGGAVGGVGGPFVFGDEGQVLFYAFNFAIYLQVVVGYFHIKLLAKNPFVFQLITFRYAFAKKITHNGCIDFGIIIREDLILKIRQVGIARKGYVDLIPVKGLDEIEPQIDCLFRCQVAGQNKASVAGQQVGVF